MSENNITAEVASGNSPQPSDSVAEPTNLDQTLDEAEAALDSEESSGETPEQAIDAAQKKGDITAQQAKDLKKKLKLKVDGEDIEEELSWDDEETLKKHLQKSKAFDKRVKDFTNYKTQVDHLMDMLKNNPEEVLEKMGLNVDELAEKRLAKKVEELKKSPEQLEREKMQKELEDLRKEKKRIEEEKQQAELEKMRNEQAQKIETDIQTALDDSKSILPKKNPLVMQRVAQTMLLAMQQGYKDVTAKDVIPLVEKQWKQELNELFAVLPEETIEMLVGKNNLDRYRKKRISAAKSKPQTQTANQVVQDTGTRKVEEKPAQKKRMRDFFSILD